MLVDKVKSLFVPLLVWSIIPYAVSIYHLFQDNQNPTVLLMVKYIIRAVLCAPWFLGALFISSFIVIVVNHFLKDSKIVYGIIIALTFVVPYASTFNFAFVFPFFLLGYFYNKYKLQEKYKYIYDSIYFLIACGIIFIALLFFYNHDSYIYTSGFYILKDEPLKQFLIDIYRFTVGLIGSIFFMLLIRKTYKFIAPRVLNIFVYIGQNTLGIYLISGYIISEFLTRLTYNFEPINYLITVIETVIITTLSLICTEVIKKSKILNRLLLGGR